MSTKLSQAIGVLTQQLNEEQAAMEQQREQLKKDRDNLEAEKSAMMRAGITMTDLVELNVGGEIVSTKRGTLLAAPEDSVLHAMFSGRWDASIERDSQGRLFLDFTPRLFLKILSHLRTVRLSPPEKELKCFDVPKEDKQEFDAMVAYLGLEGMLYVKNNKDCLKLESLNMRSCDGTCTVSILESSVEIAHPRPDGYAVLVGTSPLPSHPCFWKISVQQLKNNRWVGIGIISNAIPASESYADATSFAWAAGVHVGGEQTAASDGWSGWANGDVAIMKFDATHSCLKMYHQRLGRTFEMSGMSASQNWYIHVNLHGYLDKVLIEEATASDQHLF